MRRADPAGSVLAVPGRAAAGRRHSVPGHEAVGEPAGAAAEGEDSQEL